jgi:hypothetical protein
MSYSANDHAGDTMALVTEVIEEAIEQTDTPEAEQRLREMKSESQSIKELIIEQEGETPTQKLQRALENRE